MGVSLDSLPPHLRAAAIAQHPELAQAKTKAKQKYGNKLTEVDGVVYRSVKEAKRLSQLRQLERAGKIKDLEAQPEFPFIVTDKRTGQPVRVGAYIADAAYTVVDPSIAPEGYGPGARVVEDVKSDATARNSLYRLKKKIVAALYGVDLVEV
jgi:hypothetical protein